MWIEGEYIFESVEEALDYLIEDPSRLLTNYEKQNGIKFKGLRLRQAGGDFRIYYVEKTDNRVSMVMLVKNSVRLDIWKILWPSKEQFNFYCNDLPKLIKEIETINEKANEKEGQ